MKKMGFILVLTIFALIGCAQTTGTEHVLPMTDMTVELVDASSIEVHHFNLGDTTFTDLEGSDVSASLSGIIAVPDSEAAHPLVVLIHGRGSDEEPNYSGFDYLVQQLAAQGYVAVSLDMNLAFTLDYTDYEKTWGHEIFEHHLRYLTEANSGTTTGHGVDLAGRIDLENVHLVGHSRGGALINEFANIALEQGNDHIRSLIRLGTFEFDGASAADLPTAIVVSEFDNDIEEHQGQVVFDGILEAANHQSLASLIYLRGGNHNGFNRIFERDDRELLFYFVAQENRELWLTEEEQESFTRHYVTAFLDVVTGNREPWGVFNPSEPQPVSLFGFRVTASTYVPAARRIFDAGEREATGITVLNNMSASDHLQQPERFGNPHFFRHPNYGNQFRPEGLPFLSMIWRDQDAAVTFEPAHTDFSTHQALSLYVSVDSSNDINPEGENQALRLTLTDVEGSRQSVIIPEGTSALTYHPGVEFEPLFVENGMSSSIIEEEDIHPWQGFMPTGELRIPLSLFDALNLNEIVSFTLYFDQTPTGAIMLASVYLK